MASTAKAQSFSEVRHELSRTGLGGSDAAAVLGFSKYRTPLDVWMTCTGRAGPSDDSGPAEWGRRLEAEVLRKYAEGLTGNEILVGRDHRGDPAWYEPQPDGSVEIVAGLPRSLREKIGHLFGTLRHPDLPHLLMHLDALVIDCQSDEVLRCVDAKTTGHWTGLRDWGEEGTDETPPGPIMQLHHYAGILALNGHPVATCDVPTLIAGQFYREYRVETSVTLYRRVHQLLDEWWKAYVLTDTMPPVGSADNSTMGQLFPEDDGETIFAPDGLADWAHALGEYRDQEAEVKENRARCEAEIKAVIGEAAEVVGEGWRATWKRTKDGEKIDYEAAFHAVRAAIGLQQDHALLDACDEALADATTPKPGSRRLLTYGLAKTAKEAGQ